MHEVEKSNCGEASVEVGGGKQPASHVLLYFFASGVRDDEPAHSASSENNGVALIVRKMGATK